MKNLDCDNGETGFIEEMRVPMTDRACFFGDEVYDTALSHNGMLFALDEHIDRFFRGCGGGRGTMKYAPGGKRFPFVPLIVAAVAVLLLASCSGRITGAVQMNEQGEFIIEAELAPASARLLAPLSPSAAQSAPVLDAGVISRSLKDAPGVAAVQMRNTSPENIAGSIGFTKISDFLMAGEFRFITWEQGPASGRAVIAIDRSKGPQMISMLSQDVADYLSAIMAPIATGEPLSKTEYLRLVSSVYGGAIAHEIENAEITASISFPGHITTAQGGDFSGSTARFRAKLLDLLVLEQPLGYEVRWTPFR